MDKNRLVIIVNQVQNLEQKLNKENLTEEEKNEIKYKIKGLAKEINLITKSKENKSNKKEISKPIVEEKVENKSFETYYELLNKAIELSMELISINLDLLNMSPDEDSLTFVKIANKCDEYTGMYKEMLSR